MVWNHGILWLFIYWECHHPNWRTHIFQRGSYTTNQIMVNISRKQFYPENLEKRQCQLPMSITAELTSSSETRVDLMINISQDTRYNYPSSCELIATDKDIGNPSFCSLSACCYCCMLLLVMVFKRRGSIFWTWPRHEFDRRISLW